MDGGVGGLEAHDMGSGARSTAASPVPGGWSQESERILLFGCVFGAQNKRSITMHTVTTRTKPSGTYLTHLFGCGLDDKDHYDVQRFQSMSTGEIRPVRA